MFKVTGLSYIFMSISSQQKLVKMDIVTEILTMKQKDKKQQNKNLFVNILELILTKKNLIYVKLSMKYLDSSKNRAKKLK